MVYSFYTAKERHSNSFEHDLSLRDWLLHDYINCKMNKPETYLKSNIYKGILKRRGYKKVNKELYLDGELMYQGKEVEINEVVQTLISFWNYGIESNTRRLVNLYTI